MLWVMFKDVVVEFGVHNGGAVFLEAAAGTVGGESGEEVLCKVCSGGGRWACGGSNLW